MTHQTAQSPAEMYLHNNILGIIVFKKPPAALLFDFKHFLFFFNLHRISKMSYLKSQFIDCLFSVLLRRLLTSCLLHFGDASSDCAACSRRLEALVTPLHRSPRVDALVRTRSRRRLLTLPRRQPSSSNYPTLKVFGAISCSGTSAFPGTDGPTFWCNTSFQCQLKR